MVAIGDGQVVVQLHDPATVDDLGHADQEIIDGLVFRAIGLVVVALQGEPHRRPAHWINGVGFVSQTKGQGGVLVVQIPQQAGVQAQGGEVVFVGEVQATSPAQGAGERASILQVGRHAGVLEGLIQWHFVGNLVGAGP